MRIFYDTEFLEDGKTIDLISIGMVRENGDAFFAVNRNANWTRIRDDDWLMNRVVPNLPMSNTHWWMSRDDIRDAVVEFCGEKPEFWADYAAYDHVALCQLFGKMIDIPKGWPYFTHDIQTAAFGIWHLVNLPSAHREHDALGDARDVKDKFDRLQNLRMARVGEGSIPPGGAE